MIMLCVNCGKKKPEALFPVDDRYSTGRSPRCSICNSEASKASNRYKARLGPFIEDLVVWPVQKLESEAEWLNFKIAIIMGELAKRRYPFVDVRPTKGKRIIMTKQQYELAKTWAERFDEAAKDLEQSTQDNNVDPRLTRASIAAMRAQAEDLRNQMSAWPREAS